MHYSIKALFFFVVTAPPWQGTSWAAEPVAGYSVSRYEMQVLMDSTRQKVAVEIVVSLSFVAPTDTVVLILSSLIDSITVRDTSVNGVPSLRHYRCGKDSLAIILPTTAAPGSNLRLAFAYSYPIPGATQDIVMLDRGHRWYPMLLDNIAVVTLTVRLPDGLTAFASGDSVNENDRSGGTELSWSTRIPIFKIALVIAPENLYHRFSSIRKGVTISLLTFSPDSGWQKVCDEAADELEFFSRLVGTYPHRQFTIIEAPGMPGSNIATGLALMGSEMLQPCLKGQFEALELIVAAQWFGAGVFGQFLKPGFWFITLSMPHHLRLLYEHAKYGEDRPKASLSRSLEQYRKFAGSETDLALSAVDFPNTREKGLIIYAKGPYLLELARRRAGEVVWSRFLSSLWTEYAGRILTQDAMLDLLKSANRPAGDELGRQLEETGYPEQ
jgi:hypothetical protein